MRIAVTGSSGLIGSALVPALRDNGHEVVPIVRGTASPGELVWDPTAGTIDAAGLTGVDAIVHLAGANIGKRWSRATREKVLRSRVDGTSLIARTAAALDPRPAVLVCASGAGFYGDRGDEQLTEVAGKGKGFLADVVEAWEAAAQPARDAGIRVVQLRQGIVLSRRGGALQRLLLPFKLFVGGRVGNGRQWWSWISLEDTVSAYRHALEQALEGPVNVAAPGVVTNREFTKALGRALGRPTLLPLPAAVVRLVFGQMGDEMLLGGQRTVPEKLEQAGFVFAQPEIDAGIQAALER